MVDLNQDELYAKQLSPLDVSNALSLQNIVLPAGTAKIGKTEYLIRLNSSPTELNDLNNLPIKTVNGATVLYNITAQVHDGFFGSEIGCCPHQRRPRCPDDHHPKRQGVDPSHRRGEGRAAQNSRQRHAGA